MFALTKTQTKVLEMPLQPFVGFVRLRTCVRRCLFESRRRLCIPSFIVLRSRNVCSTVHNGCSLCAKIPSMQCRVCSNTNMDIRKSSHSPRLIVADRTPLPAALVAGRLKIVLWLFWNFERAPPLSEWTKLLHWVININRLYCIVRYLWWCRWWSVNLRRNTVDLKRNVHLLWFWIYQKFVF